MQGASTDSVQQVLFREMPDKDIMYADPTNSKTQMIPCTQNTRFTQSLTQLSGGTSVFLIPSTPAQVQDIVLQFQLQAGASGSSSNMALPLGWGYSLIKSISYRIAGSTQYFQSGQQTLIEALARSTDADTQAQIYALGGSAITTDAQFQSNNNYAYCWLSLPWTRASSMGKPIGISSDLLSSQIQITVELNPLSSIVSLGATLTSANIPTTLQSLASGQFQVQVVALDSRDDSLAASKPMQDYIYRQPCRFLNQEQSITTISSNLSNQTALLTGFRNGTLLEIRAWLTRGADSTQATATAVNPNRTYIPENLQLTYAGNVYTKYDNQSSQLWNLVNGKVPSFVTAATLQYASPSFSNTASNNQYGWATLPLAQTYEDATTGNFLVQEGLSVTNGSMQLSFRTPSAQSDWVLRLSYIYSAAICYENGSAEFVF